jgi:hypothetical protein
MAKMEGCLEKEVPLMFPIKNSEGQDIKKLTVREVVGYDEEHVNQPQIRNAPVEYLVNLVWRCSYPTVEGVSFSEEDAAKLAVPDRDNLVNQIGILSVGDDYTVEWSCRFCGANNTEKRKRSELKVINKLKEGAVAAPFKFKKPYVKNIVKEDKKETLTYTEGMITIVNNSELSRELYKKFGSVDTNNGEVRSYIYARSCRYPGKPNLQITDYQRMTKSQRDDIQAAYDDYAVSFGYGKESSCFKCGKRQEVLGAPSFFFA